MIASITWKIVVSMVHYATFECDMGTAILCYGLYKGVHMLGAVQRFSHVNGQNIGASGIHPWKIEMLYVIYVYRI